LNVPPFAALPGETAQFPVPLQVELAVPVHRYLDGAVDASGV